MTTTLSNQSLQELYEEHIQLQSFSKDDDKTELIKRCPQRLGNGYLQWIYLRDIVLLIHNFELRDSYILPRSEALATGVEFGFRVSGNCSMRNAKQNFLLNGPLDLEKYHLPQGEQLLQVDIHINSLDLLSRFFPASSVSSPVMEQLFEKAGKQPYYQTDRINRAMQLALTQLLNCPYQGLTKQIYLESKCYELMALKLEQLVAGDRDQQANTTDSNLDPDDVERIHQAKNILITHLNNPPSLLELAHQVGINDYKLKKGFRQVFGTTAFGYLLHYRLDQAHQLLATGEWNVAEVAHKVGFANRSYFTKAFCKQFGLTPGAYRRSQRRLFYTN